MNISFTVYGNQEGPKKNPCPYHTAPFVKAKRKDGTTYRRPNFTPQVRKYHAYRDHVREALVAKISLLSQNSSYPRDSKMIKDLQLGQRIQLTPDVKTEIYHLNMVYFANDARGDSENVGKGIIDAIHKQDKYVHPAAPFAFDKEKPRVEVLITTDWHEFVNRLEQFYVDRQKNQFLKTLYDD